MRDGAPKWAHSLVFTRRGILIISGITIAFVVAAYSYAHVLAFEAPENSAERSLGRPIGEAENRESRSLGIGERDRYFSERVGDRTGLHVDAAFADDIDPRFALRSDSIEEIKSYIVVTNNTSQNRMLLSVATGIQEGTLVDVRVEGATGYAWLDGELVLQYVSLLPGASTLITITGLPIISRDPVILTLAPQLRDEDSILTERMNRTEKHLVGKRSDLVEQFRTTNFQREIEAASSTPASE